MVSGGLEPNKKHYRSPTKLRTAAAYCLLPTASCFLPPAHRSQMKIHRISVPTPFYVGPVNVYLIQEDPLTLIDAGPRSPGSLEALRAGLVTPRAPPCRYRENHNLPRSRGPLRVGAGCRRGIRSDTLYTRVGCAGGAAIYRLRGLS